jgi:hypothetical protein
LWGGAGEEAILVEIGNVVSKMRSETGERKVAVYEDRVRPSKKLGAETSEIMHVTNEKYLLPNREDSLLVQ